MSNFFIGFTASRFAEYRKPSLSVNVKRKIGGTFLIIVGRSSLTSELLYTVVYWTRDRNVWQMDIPEVDRDFQFSLVNDLDTPPQ